MNLVAITTSIFTPKRNLSSKVSNQRQVCWRRVIPESMLKVTYNTSNRALINSLPNDKILTWSKLKSFADSKIKVADIMIFVFNGLENILGKEKMLDTSIFSFSHNVFNRLFTSGSLKVGIVWLRINWTSSSFWCLTLTPLPPLTTERRALA